MISKKACFVNSKLCAVTNLREWSDEELARIEAACRGGADIVQLRSKVLDKHTLKNAGHAIRKVTLRHRVLFIVNDFPDIAREVLADGVHLGQEDGSIEKARRVFGAVEFLVGRSTHSKEQAIRAEAEGADYIGIGPIFPTPTKPDYTSVGLDLIGKIAAAVDLPAVVIGGIDRARIREVLEAGAERVAVVRAIFGADDVFEAARGIKEEILAHKEYSKLTASLTERNGC